MKKTKMRFRIDFDNIRLFDERVDADKIDDVITKLKKKVN